MNTNDVSNLDALLNREMFKSQAELDTLFKPKTNTKVFTKKVRGLLILFVLICLSLYSYLKIRFNTLNLRPLNFCFINNSILTLLIPISFWKNIIRDKVFKTKLKKEYEKTSEDLQMKWNNDTLSNILDCRLWENINKYNKNFFTFCFILMVLWTVATVFLYYGIAWSSSITFNALANISILVILTGKVWIVNNRISILKWISAMVCMIGLFFLTNFRLNWTATSGNNPYHFPLLGSIFTIISAVFYSAYVIVLKYYSKKYKHYFDMMEIFGYIGLFNLFVMPFWLIILTIMQLEIFTLPSPKEFFSILGNGVITGLLCDQMQSYAVTYTSPWVVCWGIGWVVPLWYGIDMIHFNVIRINWWYIFGSTMMLISFIMVVWEHVSKNKKKLRKSKTSKTSLDIGWKSTCHNTTVQANWFGSTGTMFNVDESMEKIIFVHNMTL